MQSVATFPHQCPGERCAICRWVRSERERNRLQSLSEIAENRRSADGVTSTDRAPLTPSHKEGDTWL